MMFMTHFRLYTLTNSLLEGIAEAAKNAASGDVVLLSPACSSFDQFRKIRSVSQTVLAR
jgi:UDP-N-acetylmuramoylalanine-D-glutamate ligase